MTSRRVVILGSTGSVGVSTLDLLAQVDASIDLIALTAGTKVEALAQQALKWRPQRAIIADETKYEELKARLAGSGVEAGAGPAAVEACAQDHADWVMSAIVGAAGLAPTLAAAKAGSTIGLANKESLVCAGPALLAISKASGGTIIPVDSEDRKSVV